MNFSLFNLIFFLSLVNGFEKTLEKRDLLYWNRTYNGWRNQKISQKRPKNNKKRFLQAMMRASPVRRNSSS
ncbi:Oidioi.mRNA.OKI2018_I69.chr2.g5104.t1.cds [Oikopleura dioica]|uniref:Oidioi.mRNA.OKI2018_I69.chr2.g5104.t1.cds n=1 Tax=Oikopleura dioica TaxID=34765 RepID=A0ABN7T2Q4_OIKDI|nr:Oidioi.mRNA.OKI2018_I69.chr2.g5104.t1.cds [Oikopleura dioica]